MTKILSLLKYLLLAVSVVAVIVVAVNGEDGVGFILNWAYIMFGIGVVVTILLPLFNLAQNPRGALRSLIGLAVVVVVVGIAWAMASTEPVVNSAGGYFTNHGELKISDTGLITTYIAFGLAVLVVVLGEIRNSFK
ncbi:MAG: hypothetical protein LUD76_03625 [Alistipes sp.]|nr:hypothetical protein [Alistipes sp.]MCD8172539.1 hypothetical protein [Alistipes sp.]